MIFARHIFAGVGLAMTFAVTVALAQESGGVKSLRGGAAIDQTLEVQAPKKQNRSQSAFARAYRQQPPLIPHKIDQYQVDLKVNQCMGCHDWPRNVDVGAPKISETHYVNRSGVALDHVARTRWFCSQCHVPQTNAKELVGNKYENALQVAD